jgi:hypothetical protein
MRQEWFNPYNGRHYLVDLYEDLFGDWILIRRWWGARRAGNQKTAMMLSHADALNEVRNIEVKRRSHGYQSVR